MGKNRQRNLRLSALFGLKMSKKQILIVYYYLDFSKNAPKLKWTLFLSMHAASLCTVNCSDHSGYITIVEPYQLLCYWSNFSKLGSHIWSENMIQIKNPVCSCPLCYFLLCGKVKVEFRVSPAKFYFAPLDNRHAKGKVWVI